MLAAWWHGRLVSAQANRTSCVADHGGYDREGAWGPNSIYFHGGETAGYNSKISYDPANDMTLIVWTNLPVSLDGQQTANTLWVKTLDHIYKVSPLSPSPNK